MQGHVSEVETVRIKIIHTWSIIASLVPQHPF